MSILTKQQRSRLFARLKATAMKFLQEESIAATVEPANVSHADDCSIRLMIDLEKKDGLTVYSAPDEGSH